MRNRPRGYHRIRIAPLVGRPRFGPWMLYWGPLGDLTFTASTEHSSVVNYQANLYTDGTTTLVDSLNLGKPTPDGSNLITVHLYSWLNGHTAGNYLLKVTAIGSTGSPGSESSTGDSFVVPIVTSG